ncbi:LysR family transcriptional regulator [uncultured Roseovarius sp.]|uniref:LysR family transcriptional regulator n=1 Tax=uncultured Roseovarius sp. TaxID=293344 RepID=UPI0026325855|nr:LysR family transcriptional regulator [uncultured Roseovarius sp.]
MERAPVHGIEVFLTIVQEGSLRAAANVLGVGAPAVSLQLKALEERLGVGLIIRSTRSIELTEAGRVLFEAAGPAYRDMIYAVKKTREVGASLNGTLRLSLSRGAYVAALAPVLERFQADNPGINLELSWNEELVDINREGFHAGIRLGDVLSPDMVAVRLTGPLATVFSASPGYLDRAGRPEHPRDLLEHNCIRYKLPTANRIADWVFCEDGQDKVIDPPARLVFDHVLGVIQAAREGHGIGWSMRATAEEHLASGELEAVLDPYARALPPFYLYYPEQNKRVECLRLLIDCLVTHRDRQRRDGPKS